MTALLASLLLAGCAPRAAVSPDASAEPAGAAADAGAGAAGSSESQDSPSTAIPVIDVAVTPTSTTAATDAPAVPAEPVQSPIGPAYYATMREGWVEVLVHAKDSEQVVAMINALDGRSEMWAGDRRVAPELAALPRLRLIGSRGMSEPLAWAQAAGEIGMTEAWWRLRYRPRGNKGPFLAVQDPAPTGTKLRKPSPPRAVKKSHALAAVLVRGLAEENDSNRLPLSAHGVTFMVQVVEGSFPDAASIAIVTAVDTQAADVPLFYSLLLAIDGEGRMTRRASASIVDCSYEAYAVGDVDGNGLDDLLLEGTGYENQAVDLVLFGVDGPIWVNLFMD